MGCYVELTLFGSKHLLVQQNVTVKSNMRNDENKTFK